MRNSPDWDIEAKDAISTANRTLCRAGGHSGERLCGAVATLEDVRTHGSVGEIRTATSAVRRATGELLDALAPAAEPRNGTSGVTGVENPDGEPDHGGL